MGGFLSKIPAQMVMPTGGAQAGETSSPGVFIGDLLDSMALEMQEALILNRQSTGSGSCLESTLAYPPTRTLDVIRRCRGYMSGSGVLAGIPHIPRRRRITPKDLDIFIPLRYSEVFKNFLLDASGERHLCREVDLQSSDQSFGESKSHPLNSSDWDASATNDSSDSDDRSCYGTGSGKKSPSCIAKIWYFRDNHGREINVIVSSTRSALVPIVAFHSTPVMNFVAYFGIVSLYGNVTSHGVGWINRYPKSANGKHLWYHKNDKVWLEKYEKRGFTLWTGSDIPGVTLGGHRCGLDEACTLTVRNLFDNGVVVTKFESYQSEDSTTLLKTLEPSFVWRLRNRNCKANSSSLLKAGVVITVDEHFLL
ncbi:hypothetical protein BKA70DRAFT_1226018 [Coprinopsis sp. MPI-PUGE-AT-0042]|nr:hypothetical protein BKA70DRAFT_1226018 [Coprinopsis sp. MPI-PUGE-AT-0042]